MLEENLHYGLVSVMFTRSKSGAHMNITAAALLYPGRATDQVRKSVNNKLKFVKNALEK